MERISNDCIDELVAGVRKIYGDDLRKIILYGSTARGDFEPDSDVDVAILVNGENNEKGHELSHLSATMDLKYDIVFSLIDIDFGRFNQWVKVLPYYRNIQTEGIELWTAA